MSTHVMPARRTCACPPARYVAAALPACTNEPRDALSAPWAARAEREHATTVKGGHRPHGLRQIGKTVANVEVAIDRDRQP